jgi:hypothetical protein
MLHQLTLAVVKPYVIQLATIHTNNSRESMAGTWRSSAAERSRVGERRCRPHCHTAAGIPFLTGTPGPPRRRSRPKVLPMAAFLIMPGRADEPFFVIARSDSDAAILFIRLLGIASSLPLFAMTTGCSRRGYIPPG